VKARREEQLRVLDDDDEKGPAAEPVADPESSPDRLAERRQLIAKVQSVFRRIEEKRRRAVILHLEGLNTHEIARALNWSEPKARHLVYRGLSDLRRLLKAEGIDGEID
jgi:DNA-directed RNA polymerase specialized sigma24 family protein